MDLTKFIKTKNADALADSDRLNVLFASSEVAPFSKTGGLGDVAASLPKALASRGHRISIITPLYGHLDPAKMSLARRLQPLSVPRKGKSQKALDVTVWEGRLDTGVRIFFIDAPEYFGRSGVYGYNGDTFEDNAERFAFFSRAVVEFVRQFGVAIDVVHCNDWHTSLTPVYMNHYYKSEMAGIGSVLTLHNAAYQGTFDKSEIDATGLPKSTFLTEAKLQQNGDINFLKGGIVYSDWVTAVSPTYSEELRTAAGGFGLEGLFKDKGEQLQGILNGADYSIWSPERDHHIAVRYDQERLNGKRQNKAELQHEFGLPVRPVLPLVGFVGRLTEQKGLDLLIPTVRTLLKAAKTEREGFQMVFLGDGDAKYQKALEKLVSEFPSRVAVRFGYDDERAHRIFAGVDILAVPSEYEPCGLTQIYAMKYGTIPVVHAVGGLADTVVDSDADADKGTGFVFDKYTKAGLTGALSRAVEKYRHHRQWRPLMINAMNADFSWSQSAQEYEALYLRVREAKSPRKKATAKKTSTKKPTKAESTVEDAGDDKAAKKATAKKTTAKKPAAKKAAAESTADEEKPAAKKAAAKKPAAKKPAAKKPAAKKPAAKKPAAEKAETKKPAPKKAAPKKSTSPKSKKT